MPPTFQSNFLRFHEEIKLLNTDENKTLREKRNAVLKRMRDRGLVFEDFNQGSYAMGTGVVPLQGDYDIDVGVVFSVGTQPSSPLELKQRVFAAVYGHTPNVVWRRNCIRVQYVKAGELTYHVDLPVYWKDTGWWNPGLRLAVGKMNSGPDHTEWQPADPRGLIEQVSGGGNDEGRQQFRRVVRYLKRWKDLHFPATGNAAPIGIGLTVAALNLFAPVKPRGAQTSAEYDDLQATSSLVSRMRAAFGATWHEGGLARRLVQRLPVAPENDVFARMTNQQMVEFEQRLGTLATLLDEAARTGRPDPLVHAFGEDFPGLYR